MCSLSKNKNFSYISMASIPVLMSVFTSTDALAQQTHALEEMFVTAEKRLETQQDISASFNVYGADSIDEAGWDDITDMAGLIPGMEVVGVTKTRTSVFIRSIGTNKYDIGTEGSVGTFVDGIYIPRFSSMMQNIVDVNRIEVLKGPQGTLYGRNTIGGAISIYTEDPENEFSGSVTGEIANESSFHVGSDLSGALIEDQLLASLSFSARETGGFRTDLNTGKEDDESLINARGKLIFNISDNLSTKLIVDYLDQEVDLFAGEAVLLDGSTEILSINDSISIEERQAVIEQEASDLFASEPNNPGYSELSAIAANFSINWVDDNISFESVSGIRKEEVEEFADDDRTRFNISQTLSIQDSTTISQEFKLSSEEGGSLTFDDRLSWLAGVYLYKDDAERADLVGIYGDVAGEGPATGGTEPTLILDFGVDLETTSWAVYSQATLELADEWALTLGIRSSHDEKEFTYSQDLGLADGVVVPSFSFTDTLNYDSLDPKMVLEFRPDALSDAMFYASYTQGYKSGGIQFIATTLELAQDSFDKETLKSTEVGFKSRWLNQSLQFNTSYYHYDYTDLQVQQIIQIAGGDTITTDNAEKSIVDGLELELQYRATENWFFQLSYNYMDATFDQFVTLSGEDLSGNVMPAAPEHSAWFLTEYSHSLSNNWGVSYRWDQSLRSEQFYETLNNFSEDAYSLTNLSVNLTDNSGKYAVKLFCSNCLNVEYRSSVVATTSTAGWSAMGDLRRFGVSISSYF